MFRNLVLLHKSPLAKNRKHRKFLPEYQARIDKCLVDGVELIVLDEGHKIKNVDTGISEAICKVKTPRRVIMTGASELDWTI
jgi:hypothetical protein